MTRPIDPTIRCAEGAWDRLTRPEKASLSRLLYEQRERYKAAHELRGMAREDALEIAHEIEDAVTEAFRALRAARGV